jgi:hypothetical protein
MEEADGKKEVVLQEVQTPMKGNISKTKNVALGCSIGQVAINIEECIEMMRETAMEKWDGQMEACILVIGKEVSNMDLAKCSSQMKLLKKDSLIIICSKDLSKSLDSHSKNKVSMILKEELKSIFLITLRGILRKLLIL